MSSGGTKLNVMFFLHEAPWRRRLHTDIHYPHGSEMIMHRAVIRSWSAFTFDIARMPNE